MADAGGGGGGGVLEPVPSLRTEVESLKRERDRLQDALMRAMRSAVLFRGYLHQHQTEDESIGLLKADWEMQWFVLGSGGLLKIYDSDRDEAREPGALLYIADCLVEVEPPGVERPWCMRIVERAAPSQAHAGGDGSGGGSGLGLPLPSVSSWGSVSSSGRNELLLVAADSAAALMQWSDAFGRAGLKVVWPSAGLGRGRSRGGSGAGGGAGGSFSLGGARTNSAPLLGAAADAAAAAVAKAVLADAAAAERRGLLRQLSSLALPPLMDERAACAAADSADESPPRERRPAGGMPAAPGRSPPRGRAPQPSPPQAQAPPRRVGAGLAVARMPSVRWLRQRSKDDFAAFVDPLTPLQIEQQQREQHQQQHQPQQQQRRSMGRSKSASSVRWSAEGNAAAVAVAALASAAGAPSRPTPPPSAAPAPPESSEAALAAERTPAHGTPPRQRSVRGARRVMFGSTVVHTAYHDSLLTHPSTYSQAHSGLVTLGLVVLATTHIRALLENLLVYRLRLTLLNKSVWLAIVNTAGDNAACLLAVPGLLVFAAASLGVEWLALALLRREQREDSALGKKLDDITTTPSAADDDASPFVDDQSGRAMRRLRAHRHELVVVPLAVANCVLSLLLPCMLVFRLEAHPFPALLLTLSALVIQMKLMSYHHHNWHLRTIRRRRGPGARAPGERGGGGGDEVEAPWCALAYPENLTVNNMLFFLAVPTLTYQVNYPLLPNRRPRMLLRWVLMLLALASLQLLMIDQLLVPAMLSGLKPLADLDWWHFCERVLGLALPNLYVWLLTFVIVFHVWLNIMGEITRFADRCFYKAWWNASSLDQFWRLWNMPVHTFLMRTIYFPLIRMRVNKWWAVVCVFFWSAVMHEVAVGVPFRILRGWAFWAMFGQIPLITLTAYLRARLKNDALGNAIFWVSFCILGQPICVLLYAHEYLKREQPPVAAHAI